MLIHQAKNDSYRLGLKTDQLGCFLDLIGKSKKKEAYKLWNFAYMAKALNEKKSIAAELFLLGFDQKRISIALSVSQKTVSNWAIEGNWNANRIAERNAEVERKAMLQKIYDAQLREFSDMADNKIVFPKGALDGLHKLHSMLKNKSLELHQVIELITQFLDHISTKNEELAKQVVLFADEFIILKRG